MRINTKVCTRCHVEKEAGAFSLTGPIHRKRLHAWCRKCYNKHRRHTYKPKRVPTEPVTRRLETAEVNKLLAW